MKEQLNSSLTFILAVSIMLTLVLFLTILVTYNLTSGIFVSIFDAIILRALVINVLILCLSWMLLLGVDGYRINPGIFYKPVKWMLFFIFYPLATIPSWLPGIKKSALQESFLSFQNSLFQNYIKSRHYSELLILLPHCLQFHDCKIRITRDINDCLECGSCDVCGLKKLSNGTHLKIGIANGGTLARKIVNDTHPEVIIAVACHRDLSDGVRESWKYPVYAILNERPFGPCYDTRVDIGKIEGILKIMKTAKHAK